MSQAEFNPCPVCGGPKVRHMPIRPYYPNPKVYGMGYECARGHRWELTEAELVVAADLVRRARVAEGLEPVKLTLR